MNDRIILFMVYYGHLPNYFELWLKSVELNPTIDFCIISDCLDGRYFLPQNIKVLDWSFEQFKQRVQDKFDFNISINNYGRISQFRPALAYIFPDLVNGYAYWGFVECDLILGDIRKFISNDVLQKHDKIFKLGHFQIFANNPKMNTLFMRNVKSALDYRFAFGKDILFFEELLGMHNIANACDCSTYQNNVFADIEYSEYCFRRTKYSYPGINSKQKYIGEFFNGKLYIYDVDDPNDKLEVLYIHLQKRKMQCLNSDVSHYYIIPNSFVDITSSLLDVCKAVNMDEGKQAKKYCEEIDKKRLKDKQQRYRKMCWWILRMKRWHIRLFGGIDIDGTCRSHK